MIKLGFLPPFIVLIIFRALLFSGNITKSDSLFTLPDPDFDPSFVPFFMDSVDQLFGNNTKLRSEAIKLCGSTTNFICLFDFVLTADTKAVKESQSALTTFETEEKVLRKSLVIVFVFALGFVEGCGLGVTVGHGLVKKTQRIIYQGCQKLSAFDRP